MKKHLKIISILLVCLIFANSQVCYAAGFNTSSLIGKFLLAILGVIISSFAIFIGLKIYQKFILKTNEKLDNTDYDSLQSPKDFKEAINLFLNKTNK